MNKNVTSGKPSIHNSTEAQKPIGRRPILLYLPVLIKLTWGHTLSQLTIWFIILSWFGPI